MADLRSHSATPTYRREIDGLRAIAVLPVILFHTGLGIAPGGFLGVDVFFVISGYLITSIILSEHGASGSFSITRFYARRARRILPALFLVMAFSMVLAWAWMIPEQWEEFLGSVLFTSLFVSNVYFWQHSDYFAPDAEELPLLHTWSLAVEEQFYLFFPAVALLILRFGLKFSSGLLITVSVISLLLAQYAAAHAPVANFFLMPTRIWELLAGSLCAISQYSIGQKRNNLLAIVGLSAICVSYVIFDNSTPSPSLATGLPVLGTALFILFADSTTVAAKALSARFFVGIGLISYSAYLWHQPLFAFARIRSFYDPSLVTLACMAILTIVLAALSWRFVEVPFRRGFGASSKRVLAVALSACVLFSLASLGALRAGDPLRGSPQHASAGAPGMDAAARGLEGCTAAFQPACQTADDPEIAVWGDSYAMHLVDGILASHPDTRLIQMTMVRCGPFLDVAPYRQSWGENWSAACIKHNDSVIDWLESSDTVRYVVLSSPLLAYLSDDWQLVRRDGSPVKPSVEVAAELMERTARRIRAAGKTPIVFAPPPQSGINIGRCLATSAWLRSDPARCDFPYADRAEISVQASEFMNAIGNFVDVVQVDEEICPDEKTCFSSIDGASIYSDHGHLSRHGSSALGERMGFYELIVSARSHAEAAPGTARFTGIGRSGRGPAAPRSEPGSYAYGAHAE